MYVQIQIYIYIYSTKSMGESVSQNWAWQPCARRKDACRNGMKLGAFIPFYLKPMRNHHSMD